MTAERDKFIKDASLAIKRHRRNLQVTSAAGVEGSSNCWSAVRYNANNAWYVNMGNGNVGNNNVYNRNRLLPCPLGSADLWMSLMLQAEEDCYRNKHSSFAAARVHYGLADFVCYALDMFHNGIGVGRSRCRVIDYPVTREIFCAEYHDRIGHHLVAPLMMKVSEAAHERNGDVSFGNRPGHSALSAAKAIQRQLRELSNNWTREVWVSTRDYSGFFMSIDRQRAARALRYYAEKVVDVTDPVVAFLLDMACMYITHDATENCERRSPLEAWDGIKAGKSMFSARKGCGVPIGNFPSQIIANLVRAAIDEHIATHHPEVHQAVFVDDREMASLSKDTLKAAMADAEHYADRFGIRTNPRKKYMQRADKGVKFCGYYIKGDRLYIGNRVVHACFRMIEENENRTDTASEQMLMDSLNSYLGIMRHCRSYNIQKAVAGKVLTHHRSLYFQRRHGGLVCRQRKEYRPVSVAVVGIKTHNDEIRKIWRTRYHAHMRTA